MLFDGVGVLAIKEALGSGEGFFARGLGCLLVFERLFPRVFAPVVALFLRLIF